MTTLEIAGRRRTESTFSRRDIVQPLQKYLRERIERTLTPLIREQCAATKICLIDPPGYANVGDSAILLGELDYLAGSFPNAKLSYYDMGSYSPSADRYISGADVLLLQGGGNFGDVWPPHHRLRMRILDRFRDKKIIQLPQSIQFLDTAQLKETADLIAAQKNFTLMVRDEKNQRFANDNFDCATVLCPDMAFAMDPIERLPPRVDCFCLLRTDKEAKASHEKILAAIRATGKSFEVGDWLRASKTAVSLADSGVVRMVRRQPGLMAPLQSRLLAIRRRRAQQRVRVGIELLSRGTFVVTDRLHAHIMSCLMGIPNIIFDSIDGKVSALFETWTAGQSQSRLCNSASELERQITSLAI